MRLTTLLAAGALAVILSVENRAAFAQGGTYFTVPPGGYTKGGQDDTTDPSQTYIDELPKYNVANVPQFQISQYEITNAEYANFLNTVGVNQDAQGHPYIDTTDAQVRIHWNGSLWVADASWTTHPVTEVSWYGARDFCTWAGGRLPTEDEWEKAARWNGSVSYVYPWGDVWSCGKSAMWWCIDPIRRTFPVGSFPTGASPYGLHDMAGNVWEWTIDGYVGYPGGPLGTFSDPTRFVAKGGSWTNSNYNQRAATRCPQPPYMTDANLGFRVVKNGSAPAVLSLPAPNVVTPQVWQEDFNSAQAMNETKTWWGGPTSFAVDTGNGWFVSNLQGTNPAGEIMAQFRRDLSGQFSPGDVVDISVRLKYDRAERDYARTSVAVAWGDTRPIEPGGRGADENTGYPWYLIANNTDLANTWHIVKAERLVWGTGRLCIGFGLWANLTNEASPPITGNLRQYVDWIRVEHSATGAPTPTNTPGPSPTPTRTPTVTPTPQVLPSVNILRVSSLAGGNQLYFAAADVTNSRDAVGGGPSISVTETALGSSQSPWGPTGGVDSSAGYLDKTQCGATGEVGAAIGSCSSNSRHSPLSGSLSLAKPDGSGTGSAYALNTLVSEVHAADPRNAFNESSTAYRSWVKFRVRHPLLLGATKAYVWFRAHKPTLQSNAGETPFDDDSYWIVGSPEPAVTDRTLFYLASDGDGPGDNDGPDKTGAQAHLFNNVGEPARGLGQWLWGNYRINTATNLGGDWCATSGNKLNTEGGLVTVLHMTQSNDGFGNGLLEFYIVGREAETVAEAIKLDLACVSTVGAASFVPSDDAWLSATGVNTPTPTATPSATPTRTPTPTPTETPIGSGIPRSLWLTH